MSKAKSNSKNSCQLQTIENIVQPDSLTYECICPKTTRDLQVSERTQTCYRCCKDYHTNCLWPLEDTPGQYECPLCFLLHCLPERRVKQVLFGGYLRQTKKNKIQYRINLPLDSELLTCPIEARCVRLNRENKYQLTWPQHCSLHLNHKKIAQFKPLHSTASIKRRVDEQILLDKKLLSLDSTFVIEEKHQYIQGMRKDGNSCHFVIIAAIEPQSADEIQEEMRHKYLSVEHSKNRLRQYINRDVVQDIVVEKLKVPLKCQFYSNKITIPVRSKHCRMHYEPFDLRGFIMANINSKLSVGKWKCPICKKRAYDLEVDEYLLKIINSDTSLTQIFFNKHGQLELFAQGRAVSDKDQPSLTTNPGSDHYNDQIKGQHRVYIKKESKNHLNDSNSCQEIPLVQQSSQKSKIIFQQCIQVLDDDEDPPQGKPKRSYRFRTQTYNLTEPVVKQPRKKQKKEVSKVVVQAEVDSSSVRPIESREDDQSHFSEQEFHTKRDKKKKPKRTYHRERVGIDPPVKNIEKMAKTLVPSPSILTVTPSGIRISETTRVPEPRKNHHHHPVIEIVETEEQTQEQILQKKIKYHLEQLDKDRQYLQEHGQKDQITQSQTANFLTLCDHFLNSLLRT